MRSYFYQILVLREDDIGDESIIVTLKERAVAVHQNNKTVSKDQRLLVIIEFSMDVDKVAWNSLYASVVRCLPSGSKIIITSRSNKIIKFGTTQALVLNFLPPEAFWYFFKVLLFGSVDSSDHPKLESIAMEMARGMNGSFILANIGSGFLRENMIAQYWSICLAVLRANTKRTSVFGENPCGLNRKNEPSTYLISKNESLVCRSYRECLAEDNMPVISAYMVTFVSAKCEGEFDVVTWKSHIAPYKRYIVTCTIENSQKWHKFFEG